jgi:protease-4
LLPKPKIGIIYVDEVISGDIMPYFSLPINYAMQHRDIAAVVLVIDSPGGSAVTSEELFFRLTELRDKKPIVASVNRLAASGSYYMAIASNYIFSKPAALVGSIGVVSGLPGSVRPTEFDANTGPFKASGSSEVDWIRGMESLKNAFVSHVYEQRIYMLEHMHRESRADLLPEKDLISTGQVWFAPEAYDIGLIDALGSDLDAIHKAAELAHVANYEIVDLTGLAVYGDPTFLLSSDRHNVEEAMGTDGWQAALELEDNQDPWPNFYHIYLPPTD